MNGNTGPKHEYSNSERLEVCRAIRESLRSQLRFMQGKQKTLYTMCMSEELIYRMVDEAAKKIENGDPVPRIHGVPHSGNWDEFSFKKNW